jgi:hypothetical protein
MNDRPTAGELVEAVQVFLEKELLPGLTDARLRFQTLVAANVLSIARRELSADEAMLREEWRLLAPVLAESGGEPAKMEDLRQSVWAMNERMCAMIREGTFDGPERWRELAGVLRRLVVGKLEVANPRFLPKTS